MSNEVQLQGQRQGTRVGFLTLRTDRQNVEASDSIALFVRKVQPNGLNFNIALPHAIAQMIFGMSVSNAERCQRNPQ